jgi:tetratricopeptide (TPR) repeat protein
MAVESSDVRNQDGTPERLQAFRRSYATDGRTGWTKRVAASSLALLAFVGVAAFLHTLSKSANGGLSAKQAKEYATLLRGKGLAEQALEAYKDYLAKARLDDATRANACYSAAKLAMETGDHETALAYLYQAEMLSPPGELKPEIDKSVLACLEKLGRSEAAKRELRRRADISSDSGERDPETVVLAEFEGETITNLDLEREIEKLPPSVRPTFDDPKQKAALLRDLILERLLLDKALAMKLDEDAAVQRQFTAQRNALLVRTLIDREVSGSSDVSPEDVEQYYRDHAASFTKPGGDAPQPFESVKAQVERMLHAQRQQERLAAFIDETLRERGVRIHEDRLTQEAIAP